MQMFGLVFTIVIYILGVVFIASGFSSIFLLFFVPLVDWMFRKLGKFERFANIYVSVVIIDIVVFFITMFLLCVLCGVASICGIDAVSLCDAR